MEKNEVVELSNELTYRHYLMDKGIIHELFQKMTIPEYIALHMIVLESESTVIYGGRTYLKELSEKMQLTIRQTSKMVGELRDRGLILWSHDGNGSEGTYVTITEMGRKLLEDQEQILKKYYGKVIGKFGKENMIKLLQLMKQLETVMSSEIEEMEATKRDERLDRNDE
ncbi:MAG: MarR family transcriptional regulator [bacterium]|nr:MarR family transcriptional regulator [bacterium]